MGANLCCINGPSSPNKRPKPKIITSSVQQQHHASTPEKYTKLIAENLTLGACVLEEDTDVRCRNRFLYAENQLLLAKNKFPLAKKQSLFSGSCGK